MTRSLPTVPAGTLIRPLLVLVLSCVTLSLSGLEAGATPRRRPLDLPAGGRDATDSDDSPELIVFYGGTYQGDGFFWCLDRSGSMAGERLAILKLEMGHAIAQLSSAAEFAVVAFSSSVTEWSDGPRRATGGHKLAARAWVDALEAEGSTCIGDGVVRTLELSHQAAGARRTLLVLSDGLPWCENESDPQGELAAIAAANSEATPIHTIFIGDDAGGIAFMQELAAQEDGSFRHVTES